MANPHTNHPELAPLIARIYHLFDEHPERQRIEFWFDQPGPEFEAKCRREAPGLPVVRLSQDVFDDLGWHALSNDAGYLPTIFYFLPRMLDEAIYGLIEWRYSAESGRSSPRVPLEMIFDVMVKQQWQTWRQKKVEALDACFMALWRCTVSRRRQCEQDMFGLLIAAGYSLATLQNRLAQWPETLAACAIAQLICHQWNSSKSPRRFDCWDSLWGNTLKVDLSRQEEVVRWLGDLSTRQRLEDAFFSASGAEDVEFLSEAIAILDARR
jgi:hypothetical protein